MKFYMKTIHIPTNYIWNIAHKPTIKNT